MRKKITGTPPSNALTFGLWLGADTGAAFVLLPIFLDSTGSRHGSLVAALRRSDIIILADNLFTTQERIDIFAAE